MLLYALISAFKQHFTLDDSKIVKSETCQPNFQFPVEILVNLMRYLEPVDSVKLMRICTSWSGLAAEAFYQSPPYNEGLQTLIHSTNNYHPYELFIRELSFSGQSDTESSDLLMGDLEDLLKCCPNVISLRLDSFWNLSNLLPIVLSEHLPFLARIELPGCQIGDNFILQLIRKVFTLRYIDVSYTNVTLSTLPVIIRECLYLETLDMTGTKKSDEHMVQDYEASEYYLVGDTLKRFKSFLTQISLSNTLVKDDMIAYVAKHCPNLERIILNNCYLVTDSAVYSIAMHCLGLKELDIGFCSKLTDIGIQSLAVHFSSHAELLEKTEKSKRRVFSMSSLDTRIPPSYQSHADYQPVLRVHVHAQLERIVLTNMTNLSHSSVCLLASKCPKLNDIVLDGCDSVIEWYSPWMPSSVDSSSTFDNGIEDLSFQSTELKEVHQLRVSRHDILERAGESNKILNDS